MLSTQERFAYSVRWAERYKRYLEATANNKDSSEKYKMTVVQFKYITIGQRTYYSPVTRWYVDTCQSCHYEECDWQVSWKGEITSRCYNTNFTRYAPFTRSHKKMPQGKPSHIIIKLLERLT